MNTNDDIRDRIAAAKLPERSVPVCLRGDLIAEFEGLEREHAEANRPSNSLADGGKAREIAERMEALRVEMTAASVEFQMRAIARRRWTELLTEHPVRPDIESDKSIGVNEATFYDALIRECTISPSLMGEEWTHLFDEVLTTRQYEQLALAAWNLNRRDVDVPFSPAASRTLLSTDSE